MTKKVVRAWAVTAYGELSWFEEACIYETYREAKRSLDVSKGGKDYLKIEPVEIRIIKEKSK